MFWGMGSLGMNIILNSILMYVFKFETDGAAWASVAGRIVSLSSGLSLILFTKSKIGFKPWTIFAISKEVIIKYFKKSFYAMAIFTVTFLYYI